MKDLNPACCDPDDFPLLMQAKASTSPIAPTDTAISMGISREIPSSLIGSCDLVGGVTGVGGDLSSPLTSVGHTSSSESG